MQPQDAVVVVGCLPPPSQYFAVQTNVYSRFAFNEELNQTGIFFPQVAPYDSINTASIQTLSGSPHNSVYIVISTADQGTADAITNALVLAGAPREAINYDSLTHDDVNFGKGGDWREELPDALQMVFRLNGPDSQQAASGEPGRCVRAHAHKRRRSRNHNLALTPSVLTSTS